MPQDARAGVGVALDTADGGSGAPRTDSGGPARRKYVRLPSDEELLAHLAANGYRRDVTAAEIGCSPTAITLRLAKIAAAGGPPVPRAATWRPIPGLSSRVEALTEQLAALEARLAALEARPAVVEWRPDHRRIADGGTHIKAQRRAMRRRLAG